MPQVHKFSTPSAFCGAVNGHTFASKDPKAKKIFMNIAMGSRPPGFHHHAIQEEECEPELPVCDITSLPVIETVLPPYNNTCVANQIVSLAGTYATVSAVTNFYDKFTRLVDLLAVPIMPYGNFCTTENLEIGVIFDEKVFISWGKFINVSGTAWRDTTYPLIFPGTFTTFELVLHSLDTNLYYSTLPRFKFSL